STDLLLLASSILIYQRRSSPPAPAVAAKRPVSIALVPFRSTAEDRYAGEGIAESLFRRLAPLQALQLSSRKSEPAEYSVAGVGAENVLRGSIHHEGDR